MSSIHYGQEELENRFLGFFEYDDWYGGISHYLDACDEFLTLAAAGDPVRLSYWEYFPMGVGLGCLGAGLVCLFLLRGMKSVKRKKEANAYITDGGLHLTVERDEFQRTVVTRSKIEKESSAAAVPEAKAAAAAAAAADRSKGGPYDEACRSAPIPPGAALRGP